MGGWTERLMKTSKTVAGVTDEDEINNPFIYYLELNT